MNLIPKCEGRLIGDLKPGSLIFSPGQIEGNWGLLGSYGRSGVDPLLDRFIVLLNAEGNRRFVVEHEMPFGNVLSYGPNFTLAPVVNAAFSERSGTAEAGTVHLIDGDCLLYVRTGPGRRGWVSFETGLASSQLTNGNGVMFNDWTIFLETPLPPQRSVAVEFGQSKTAAGIG